MQWLDERWPEDSSILFDTKETVTSAPTTIGAQICLPNPYRTALLIGLANATASVVVSTKSPVAVGQGFLLAPNAPSVLVLNSRDLGALVSLPWFCLGLAAGGVVTTVEAILNRPIARPPTPVVKVETDQAGADNSILRRLLRRQAAWRRRIYQQLSQRFPYAANLFRPGARLATSQPSAVRFPQSSVPALPGTTQPVFGFPAKGR